MKISIIGTNGFLSVAIAKFFNSENCIIDMYGLQEPCGHEYDAFFKTNLLEDKLDYDILVESDIIIYASGAGIQSNLKESASLIYKLNVDAPVEICNMLKHKGYTGIFITFGSVFEMGMTPEKRAFLEEDILTSLFPAPNDYAVSKRMLSRFVNSYSHNFTHWHFFIPTIYGEKENPARLIPYIINTIKSNGDLKFTSGDQVRSYICVNEVPLIINQAYHKKLESGCYNIGGVDTLSVKEIVYKIHKYFGKEVPSGCFGVAERQDAGMKYLQLDGSKLYNRIEFSPSVHIEDIISRY